MSIFLNDNAIASSIHEDIMNAIKDKSFTPPSKEEQEQIFADAYKEKSGADSVKCTIDDNGVATFNVVYNRAILKLEKETKE